MLIISKLQDDSYVVIIAPPESTFESQLVWLFDISSDLENFDTKIFGVEDDKELDYASRYVLKELGIEIEETDKDFLDLIFKEIGETFPTTKVFSKFSRSTLPQVSAKDNPDRALLKLV